MEVTVIHAMEDYLIMKKTILISLVIMIFLSVICSCESNPVHGGDTSGNATTSGSSSLSSDILPPGTLGEPLKQDGVVQDYKEGTQVEVSLSDKSAAAYYYDPRNSDEYIVFIDPVPNDKEFRHYLMIYKPDFNGVNGLISDLSKGVFQAEYVRKIIFSRDEVEYCVNSMVLIPEYCSAGEIITGVNPPAFGGEGQEQYYCIIYSETDTTKPDKNNLIALPEGRFASIIGNNVSSGNSGKLVSIAESNFRRLFERYGINGILG